MLTSDKHAARHFDAPGIVEAPLALNPVHANRRHQPQPVRVVTDWLARVVAVRRRTERPLTDKF